MTGMQVRSRLPLFQTDHSGHIVEWNGPAEELSGIPAREAVGRGCWEVIRGRDTRGAIVCHPGCSAVRLAGECRPVACTDLRVRMPSGVERLTVSTITVGTRDDGLVLRPLHVVQPDKGSATPWSSTAELTPRQREILALLADGMRAREIACRLSLSVATVRNHIQAVLRELGVHSQLEAVARSRAQY